LPIRLARRKNNLALEQRIHFWRQAKAAGIKLNFVSQGRELTQLRREYGWLAAIHSTPLVQALRDLDRAFAAYFAGLARYPKFQAKGRNVAFRHRGLDVAVKPVSRRWSLVWVPKIGWTRLRHTRPIVGRSVSATFSRDALGWHVAITCEIEREAPANTLPAVGIDRGIANTVALSTGEMFSAPDLSRMERRKKLAQRVLARRIRGSNRYLKQRKIINRLAAKMARCHKHWRHGVSLSIASRYGLASVEALKIQNMAGGGKGKRGLNRTNAAKIILRRSTAGVEGSGCAPDEARTLAQAA
jgi:putative transposase